ncbi:MFS general substrate transporter [Pseudohyphozyma bogoriensis]|nr:MFS general substrate transporter [Pseudohyphozyma bogoriensis]
MSSSPTEKTLDSPSPPRSDVDTASVGSPAEKLSYTVEEEARVVRKVDWALLPGLTALYLLSFLDRSNIGNAKLLGMLTDIGITDASAYNTSLALYFATCTSYVLFEIPAQIVLKKLNPRIWLPTITIAWGITATLQGLISNEKGFYAARFFMGVAEAGLFPGVIFVFSMFYKRNERHWRVAVFFGGAALAGAFGGVLAWAIGHMNNVGTRPSWAWIFILEGLLTVVVGVSAYFWVPRYPRESTFLNPRELEILLARLAEDGDSADKEAFEWKGVAAAFKDHLVIAYSFLFHGFAFPLYSLSLFLPTIISGLGYASWKAQLLTIPPYGVAFLSILLFAFTSHKSNKRGLWIIIGGAIALVGYIVLLATNTSGARYAGVFVTVIGIYSSNALLLSWPAEDVSPQTKRATASGMQIFIGDIGAISGVLVYRPSLVANFYRTPHIVAIAYTVFGMLVAAYLWIWMSKENKRREATRAEGKEEGVSLALDSAQLKGDRHPDYRYQL